ncbi:tRNA (adenine57-N1/adenine58-N1)-methyltransferase catalytic subunit [Nematocida major]|uniref:tRNA (adenine57-N1/adenine58-N1)-methyltransferase catalytic subunit n=1 Tax=Nematocida major TaxID=1912982 RepID=UPI00200822B6|nr:tRNA (adenine57-N1/adenine58-N1)-methyltransferase catalytic subunit [Nematocida major]KAH9385506.1 tRNA (adenine57-N1/adenine58-N1)-methyltransferase catalytic subunit [Nematocida major]
MRVYAEYFNKKLKRAYTEKAPTEGSASAPPVLLEMDCNRWIKTTSQRTQIIYRADASIILYHMALCRKARVIESGTGTLGLTYVLSRYFSEGRVDTVECNAGRFAAAEADVQRAGLSNVKTHFGTVQEYLQRRIDAKESPADGLVLDVPEPEGALKAASCAVRPGGVVVCFVPCIEQIQRIMQAVQEIPAMRIDRLLENVEILHRPATIQTAPAKVYGTKPDDLNRGHTGYIMLLRLSHESPACV